MSIFSRTPPHPPGELVELRREHLARLRRFLERDPINNLFALSWLENYGVTPKRDGLFHFLGVLNTRGELDAVALVITKRLILLDSRNQIWAKRMGEWYAQRGYHLHHIVSVRHLVDAFWGAMREHNTLPEVGVRLASPQFMYALKRQAWLEQPASALEDVKLQPARIGDLDAIFLASAAMHQEETLEDPLRDQPELFRHCA